MNLRHVWYLPTTGKHTLYDADTNELIEAVETTDLDNPNAILVHGFVLLIEKRY